MNKFHLNINDYPNQSNSRLTIRRCMLRIAVNTATISDCSLSRRKRKLSANEPQLPAVSLPIVLYNKRSPIEPKHREVAVIITGSSAHKGRGRSSLWYRANFKLWNEDEREDADKGN